MKSREIKFKAWDKIEKKFFPISEIYTTIDNSTIVAARETWNSKHHTIGHVEFLQFIGMLDKNKKEIFEGDIVQYAVKRRLCPVCSEKEITSELGLGISRFCPDCGTKTTDKDFITIAKVVFDKGGFAYYHENEGDTYQSWPTHSAEIYIAWVEIVGNIYENPGLLKIKKQFA